jgi:hypothetical protein
VIAAAVFWFARPIALLFSSERDFFCRRNAWFAVTVAAFLCPTFWLFFLCAALIIVRAARRDSNACALYLMLLNAVPNYSWRVPMVGISYLVDLDFQMLLSLCLMVPVALRLLRSEREPDRPRLQLLDYFLLAYLALTSVYYVLPELAPGVLMTPTATHSLRLASEAFVSIFVPYFVISRSGGSRQQLQDMLATLCLTCTVMAAIAIFESARHWLLYTPLLQWGAEPGSNPYASLQRAGTIRASASMNHPLFLGYMLAVAFGLWLCLMSRVRSVFWRSAVIVVYWLGLLATYERGPWVGGILIYFAYVVLSGRKLSKLLNAGVAAGLVAAIIAATPLGDRIASVVPFLGGSVDVQNITYRERLLDAGWNIVQKNPLLGDQHALAKLQFLRVEGIIDLMNGFVNVLLGAGFVGLSLLLCFVALGLYAGWRLSREVWRVDPDLAAIASALVACLLATMLMMWVGGLLVAQTCLLVGLISACALAGSRQRAAGADVPAATGP